MTTYFYSGVVGTLVLTLARPFVWQTPDLAGWATMVALELLGGGGHFMIIHALRRAPAFLLAPFGYIQLVWVTILGYLVFGDFPDGFTILGAFVVVSSGAYVFYREGVVRDAA